MNPLDLLPPQPRGRPWGFEGAAGARGRGADAQPGWRAPAAAHRCVRARPSRLTGAHGRRAGLREVAGLRISEHGVEAPSGTSVSAASGWSAGSTATSGSSTSVVTGRRGWPSGVHEPEVEAALLRGRELVGGVELGRSGAMPGLRAAEAWISAGGVPFLAWSLTERRGGRPEEAPGGWRAPHLPARLAFPCRPRSPRERPVASSRSPCSWRGVAERTSGPGGHQCRYCGPFWPEPVVVVALRCFRARVKAPGEGLLRWRRALTGGRPKEVWCAIPNSFSSYPPDTWRGLERLILRRESTKKVRRCWKRDRPGMARDRTQPPGDQLLTVEDVAPLYRCPRAGSTPRPERDASPMCAWGATSASAGLPS